MNSKHNVPPDGAALIRELRCEDDRFQRYDLILRDAEPPYRSIQWQQRRKHRLWRTALFADPAFQYTAQTIAAAGGTTHDLWKLFQKLSVMLHHAQSPRIAPRALRRAWKGRQADQNRIANTLRNIAGELMPSERPHLEDLARAVRTDPRTLLRCPDGLELFFDFRNISTRGGGRNASGQWRGFYTREIAVLVPDAVPDRYATISRLLAHVGVRVTSAYVRSILARGHT